MTLTVSRSTLEFSIVIRSVSTFSRVFASLFICSSHCFLRFRASRASKKGLENIVSRDRTPLVVFRQVGLGGFDLLVDLGLEIVLPLLQDQRALLQLGDTLLRDGLGAGFTKEPTHLACFAGERVTRLGWNRLGG